MPDTSSKSLRGVALHHLTRASGYADSADAVLETGDLNENAQAVFGLQSHMASIHAQIASAATQIINAAAVDKFPEILTRETTRLEAGAVAQEETKVTYRVQSAEDKAQPLMGRIHTTENDMEAHAEWFNEGFDTAHRQGVGGDHSREWLLGKLKPFLDDILGSSETPYNDEVYDQWLNGLADDILDDSLVEEADSDPRPDQKRGLYGKYEVHRLHDPEGKHADDRFFVLDPTHDIHAVPALRRYAEVARKEFPKLSDDLDAWLVQLDRSWEGQAQ